MGGLSDGSVMFTTIQLFCGIIVVIVMARIAQTSSASFSCYFKNMTVIQETITEMISYLF